MLPVKERGKRNLDFCGTFLSLKVLFLVPKASLGCYKGGKDYWRKVSKIILQNGKVDDKFDVLLCKDNNS